MQHTQTTGEEEEDFAKTAKVRCEGAHPLLALLSRWGLTPINLAYNLRRADSQLC